MAARLLIVDDERDIVSMLERYFSKRGYEVLTAPNGTDALNQISKKPDIVLLDVNMPDMDGFAVCKRIRADVACPILFLTARIEDADKVRGFSVGGDDYVIKPFSIDELGARVAAHLRREARHATSMEVRMDERLTLNYTDRSITMDGVALSFAKKEFDIIELLSQHPGQIFDKERIYELVWGYDGQSDSSVVAERIRRIRARFAEVNAKPYIETIWGCGYKWVR